MNFVILESTILKYSEIIGFEGPGYNIHIVKKLNNKDLIKVIKNLYLS